MARDSRGGKKIFDFSPRFILKSKPKKNPILTTREKVSFSTPRLLPFICTYGFRKRNEIHRKRTDGWGKDDRKLEAEEEEEDDGTKKKRMKERIRNKASNICVCT